jgi:serine protease Do
MFENDKSELGDQGHTENGMEIQPGNTGIETNMTERVIVNAYDPYVPYASVLSIKQQENTASKKKKVSRMGFAAALVTVCMVVSMAAGFGSTYLSNNLANNHSNNPTTAYDDTLHVSQPTTTTEPLQELTIPEIVALTADSVVEIYTETVVNDGRFGQYVTEGAGSGVIFSSDGYIVTNNHVIDGAQKITVRLRNGDEYEATLIGSDSKTDLAVLKIKETGLQSVVFGDSDKLVVGELVVAIGNPLGKLGGTVTEGIISALSREVSVDGKMMNLLQISAAVNPGNSGGGLFNSYGELIGIVNAKSSGSGIEGLGFAIPVNIVKAVIEDLIKLGA